MQRQLTLPLQVVAASSSMIKAENKTRYYSHMTVTCHGPKHWGGKIQAKSAFFFLFLLVSPHVFFRRFSSSDVSKNAWLTVLSLMLFSSSANFTGGSLCRFETQNYSSSQSYLNFRYKSGFTIELVTWRSISPIDNFLKSSPPCNNLFKSFILCGL